MSFPGPSEAKGKCLSLHQPWASLLVFGVKRIEGRPWGTEYRGRLWIHATSKQPTAAVIQEVEDDYRAVYELEGQSPPPFPPHYPTSALVGCVDVVDCLKAEQVEAWENLPASLKMEVGSPFAFLCENPRQLVVPQQMRGYPGLWDLPKDIPKRMEIALRTPDGDRAFTWSKYPVPEGLRRANLRRSENAFKWQDRYGSSSDQDRRPRQEVQSSRLPGPARPPPGNALLSAWMDSAKLVAPRRR